ncbi:hypothetical protein C8R44DRAFT_750239 [Mycena epipterygia]|nr:hypothetical protein C8R44DRAFT_750239 [Mycena epipterygia]
MPSIARAILLALHASTLLALTGLSPATINALASPLPGSSLAVPANSPSSLLAARVISKHTDAGLTARAHAIAPAASIPLQQRQSSAASEQLREVSKSARANADTMKALRAQASSVQPGDREFQQKCATALTSYKTTFARYQSALEDLSTGAGLTCYDRADDVETLIKAIINYHKEILACTTDLVNALPLLGPILGPIVYDIKCLVEELLDATEVLTDCILNLIAPLLQALGLSAVTDLLCSIGLCLL